MAELKYWVWLTSLGAQRRDIMALLEHFGPPDEIYFAGEADYKNVLESGWEPFLNKSMAEPRRIMRVCEERGYDILTLHDARYPQRLKNIFDPPAVLYVRGKLPNLDELPAVAVVGTRSCTPYGLVNAEKLSYEAARCGAVIVTGLARGIDSAAARGALRAGGRVVGVLGCGPDVVYPKSNEPLFDDVAASGAIITEFPPGTPPSAHNFPVRNRIMSGVSVGVVVIEAPERSGALITAALALEQGRDVFVMPGNIDAPSCLGSNSLMKEGAIPVMSGWDIVSQYESLFPDRVKNPDMVELRPLDGGAAEELTEKELPEAGRRKRLKNILQRTVKRADTGQETTKKAIDNAGEADYIDIIVDAKSLSLDERAVLEALKGRRHVDEIIADTGLPPQAVMSALTMLEIQGAVTQEPGKLFTARCKISDQ